MSLKLQEAKAVLKELIDNVVTKGEKDDKEREALLDEIRKELQYELCKLTLLAVPEATTKMAEIVYAEEKKHKVSEKRNGADLITEDGSKLEHKLSKTVRTTGYKCNVNIPFPKAKTIVERRKKMLESIEEKTEGPSGGMVIEIVTKSTGRTLNEYFLSNLFLTSYFEDLEDHNFPGDSVSTINWGCKRCVKCESYHKLNEMRELDERLSKIKTEKKRNKFRRKDEDWRNLIGGKIVKAQCVK